MLGWFKEIQAEWPNMSSASKWAIVVAGIAGGIIGYAASSLIGSGQLSAAREHRDLYASCLSTGVLTPQCQALSKNAPIPKQAAPQIQYVPVPDPKLLKKFEELEALLGSKPAATKPGAAPQKQSSVSVSVPGYANVVTFGQSGGTNIGTFVTGQRPPRRLDVESQNRLLALLPAKVEEVRITVLTGVGSPERENLAKEIQGFLRTKGYNVRDFIGWYLPLNPITPGVAIAVGKENPPIVEIAINENA